MKGSVHAAIGASVPAGLVVTQGVTALQGVTMAGIAAGFALLPDLDSPNSCASKALGGLVHKLVHKTCKAAVTATALPRDVAYVNWMKFRQRDPYHRTLTHTLVATLAIGCLVYGAAWMHPVGAAFTAALGVFLLWPLYRRTIGLVVICAALVSVGAVMLLEPWLITLAATGGYASHIAGDACTKAGVPVLWPVTVQRKRWWNIRLLGSMVTSGSTREKGPAVGVSLAANALLVVLDF